MLTMTSPLNYLYIIVTVGTGVKFLLNFPEFYTFFSVHINFTRPWISKFPFSGRVGAVDFSGRILRLVTHVTHEIGHVYVNYVLDTISIVITNNCLTVAKIIIMTAFVVLTVLPDVYSVGMVYPEDSYFLE